MDRLLKEIHLTPKAKKVARHSTKPFWNETLTLLWRESHSAEKSYVKDRKMGFNAIKNRFITLQKAFDRELEMQALVRALACLYFRKSQHQEP